MIFKKELTMNWWVGKKKKERENVDLVFETIVVFSKHGSSSGFVGIKVMIFLLLS